MLQRIQAGIQADNEASRRVLVKCGFEREGVARDFLLIEEGWKDHVIYATTRPDYIRATVTS
jgi:ribosomal-protein-alanine N-acetyltransferase